MIEDNVSIAFGVLICTSSHQIGNEHQRAGVSDRRPVIIESGYWIGANVTILPGGTVGKGCVIAAGSIVNKSCTSNGVYACIPAKRIREL